MSDESRLVLDQAALDDLFTSKSGAVGLELAQRAVMVDRRAKQLCPVDTGRLRSSINWGLGIDAMGIYAVIGTDVEYAAYVEMGTGDAPAQPFLRPALDAARGVTR